jgi:hypothetical protein
LGCTLLLISLDVFFFRQNEHLLRGRRAATRSLGLTQVTTLPPPRAKYQA